MHITSRTRSRAKKSFIPRAIASLLKKRQRMQAIRADLAARTLYMVDGDDIVITSLDRKPFCCQEELACMCRAELYRVARELNLKLPAACRIEPLSVMSAPVIRGKIEEVMGFRHFRPDTDISIALSMRGKRSPTSSFSSATSRSSIPSTLYVVKELDEI